MKQMLQISAIFIFLGTGIGYYKYTMKEYEKEFKIQESLDRSLIPIITAQNIQFFTFNGESMKSSFASRQLKWLNNGKFFLEGALRYVEYNEQDQASIILNSSSMEGRTKMIEGGRSLLDSQLSVDEVFFKEKVLVYYKDQVIKVKDLNYNILKGKAWTDKPVFISGEPLNLQSKQGGWYDNKEGIIKLLGNVQGTYLPGQ